MWLSAGQPTDIGPLRGLRVYVLRVSASDLKEQQFAGIILDEAQNIKNHGTQAQRW